MHFCEKSLDFFTNGFAGGGSQPFNHFHAELTTRADSQVLETALQKNAAYFLGCHTDSILLRKICQGVSG